MFSELEMGAHRNIPSGGGAWAPKLVGGKSSRSPPPPLPCKTIVIYMREPNYYHFFSPYEGLILHVGAYLLH